MPSNNTGKTVRDLFEKYPERIALLISPDGFRPHRVKYPYAIDNGAFKKFKSDKFFKVLDRLEKFNPPIFVVCPDVVGCHDRTKALWGFYYPILSKYKFPIAFVAQDGCEPEDIPKNADWVFVGGTDPWKMNNAHKFIGLGKPVHVGRVNTMDRLRQCESIGADSIDGTGWMRFRGKQFNGLMEWLGE